MATFRGIQHQEGIWLDHVTVGGPHPEGGNRAVKISVWHLKGRGVILLIQPIRQEGNMESFEMFGTGLNRAKRQLLVSRPRRSDKFTQQVAGAIAPMVPDLAAEWLQNPDSAESATVLQDVLNIVQRDFSTTA